MRARTFEDAYSICEDELFPEATETVDELIKEYGFKVERFKVVKDSSILTAGEHTAAGERFAVYPDDYPESNGGRLLPEFVRWETMETPNPDAWSENECFCEGFGFRPSGPNSRRHIETRDLFERPERRLSGTVNGGIVRADRDHD